MNRIETARIDATSCVTVCRLLSSLCVLVALLATPLARAGLFGPPSRTQVDVVVDVGEDGRKLPPPTTEHPAYYYPLMGGYKAMGATVAGEKPPAAAPIAHLLAKVLAGQHYFVVGSKTPPPTLLLVFNWGYINPQMDEVGAPGEGGKVFYNQSQMLALVAGHTLNALDFTFDREDVMQAAEDNRYFVIVSAYDFAAAQQKKKKLLWRAKMSVPSNGVEMVDVLPAMIESGGPHFGRETARPAFVPAPVVPPGKVQLGTPRVVPDSPHPSEADPSVEPVRTK